MADIPDQPGALNLIAESIRTLTQTVLPQTSGDERLALMMVISALGMAQRELELQPDAATLLAACYNPVQPGGAAALVAAIRAGEHDGSDDLYAALQQASSLRTLIAKPKALTQHDHATLQAFFIANSG
jgi:Domain of unknown function (DUF6285)